MTSPTSYMLEERDDEMSEEEQIEETMEVSSYSCLPFWHQLVVERL